MNRLTIILAGFFLMATTGVIQAGGNKLETATFGSGCFWCTEAVFQRVIGVETVVSGYMGGHRNNPTYEQVCTGTTGHAEVIQITYNPGVISYAELLEIFFRTHDPTQLNRQGNDIGTQYRSVIFYHTADQEKQARFYLDQLNKAGVYSKPVVTEISSAAPFWPAEDYHQNYFNRNPGQGYCAFVVKPKVEKFKAVFKEKLKPGS